MIDKTTAKALGAFVRDRIDKAVNPILERLTKLESESASAARVAELADEIREAGAQKGES